MISLFKSLLLSTLMFISAASASAQELRANVQVIADRIQNTDPKTFETLQNAVKDFLNNRKWTNKTYQPGERITCNFVLNITQQADQNTYQANLTVQSTRPVYNSAYQTTILNYQDKDVTFKYVEFQPLDFNANRVSGNDPMQSNLTAILAYYAYVIIGLDADSYSPGGGDTYFKAAENIVNNAPENSKLINGWKPFESTRNRYWIVANLLNTRFNLFHQAMYQYYRLGLDKMYDNMNQGRAGVLNSLNMLYKINQENPNSMIIQLFFVAKSDEIAGVFSKGPLPDKQRAQQLLAQLDPSQASKM